MLTLNFFEKIGQELVDFFMGMKDFIIGIFSSIHHFLNRFMNDDILIVFGIAISAFIAILFFRYVINKR